MGIVCSTLPLFVAIDPIFFQFHCAHRPKLEMSNPGIARSWE